MKRYAFILLLLLLLPAAFTNGQPGKGQVENLTIQAADSLFAAGEWQRAARVYEHLLKSAPQNSAAWGRLGSCYHHLKKFEDALSHYNRALHHGADKNLPVLYSRIAMVYALQGEIDKGFSSLAQAVDHGYQLAGELQQHEDFAVLRGDKRFGEILRRATDNALPCMRNAQLRQFDFWVGTWDVYPRGTNRLAGESIIEVASGGCMILENWTSKGPAPFSGKSVNYVNPATATWEQLWIGSEGVNRNNPQKFVNGVYREGAMRFEFEQWTEDGKKQTGRFTFFHEGPDQVRQFNEVSDDGGKTWTTVYDFVYKRRQ